MKASIVFDLLMKLVLRFDLKKLEKWRFQTMIQHFFMDYSTILMECDDSNRTIE